MNKTAKLLLAGALVLLALKAMQRPAQPEAPEQLDEAQPQANPLQAAALEGYLHRRRRGVLYNGLKKTA